MSWPADVLTEAARLYFLTFTDLQHHLVRCSLSENYTALMHAISWHFARS